ncbi:hypothetical protein CPB83DRAFT_244601 [Crepidotus variabilis]|uniref:Uncharacterized protein n=1 Tax=Crepidotus variabilis TaxID=179855 RepID=A0A9P6EJU0_9AGAR|nr:hypothetical protein CPB83DRAFT_244601 [Crepidotus variabilis]
MYEETRRETELGFGSKSLVILILIASMCSPVGRRAASNCVLSQSAVRYSTRVHRTSYSRFQSRTTRTVGVDVGFDVVLPGHEMGWVKGAKLHRTRT